MRLVSYPFRHEKLAPSRKSKRLLVSNAVVTTDSAVVVVGGTDGVSVVTTASGDAVY